MKHTMERAGLLLRVGTLAMAAALAGCGGSSSDAATIQISGAVTTPSSPDYITLSMLPATTQTDTFSSAGVSETDVFTGPTLWNVLNSVGITVDATRKNNVLNRYVLATGADGYKVVFSLGELDPDFGNRASLLAYAQTVNGISNPLVGTGPYRITSAGDLKGGRYVSNLLRLDVRASGSTSPTTGAGGVSTSFTVSGAVLHPGTYNLASLQALAPVTLSAGGSSYTGVSLFNFLNTTAGLQTDATVKNDSLRFLVVATGSDGYKAAYSMGELDTGFGNQPDLIAYAQNGAALTTTGFARVVIPNDVKAGRWVSNLISIEVIAAPAAQ